MLQHRGESLLFTWLMDDEDGVFTNGTLSTLDGTKIMGELPII